MNGFLMQTNRKQKRKGIRAKPIKGKTPPDTARKASRKQPNIAMIFQPCFSNKNPFSNSRSNMPSSLSLRSCKSQLRKFVFQPPKEAIRW